jgi:hypothetical protein
MELPVQVKTVINDIPYELGIDKGDRFPLHECCLEVVGRLMYLLKLKTDQVARPHAV